MMRALLVIAVAAGHMEIPNHFLLWRFNVVLKIKTATTVFISKFPLVF